MQSVTRRQFLGGSLAIGGAVVLPHRKVYANSVLEQVNVGVIGCGGRGGALLKQFDRLPDVQIAGLCDPDQKRLDDASKHSPQAKKWTDMRNMLDSPDIDAVVVATCNHWHCLAAIWAMQAGKHVYVEKPLGHSQWEGDQVVAAAARYNRSCQVGTQQRSDPMQAEIKQFLHEDKTIGEIQAVRVNRFGVRESIGRRDKPLVPPKTVDYDLWLGPAQELPMYRNKFHYDWHWDWNTGSGEMGNWGVHILDDVRNNVFLDRFAAPSSISAAGGRYGWADAGATPNVHFATLEVGGIPLVVTLSNLPLDKSKYSPPGPGSGYIAYCSAGRFEGQRGRAWAYDSEGKLLREFKGDSGDGRHQQNFIDSIREQKPEMLTAPATVGNDSTAWCNLINVASRVRSTEDAAADAGQSVQVGEFSASQLHERLKATVADSAASGDRGEFSVGPTLAYDAQQSVFVGDHADAANALLTREYRGPFTVPDIAKA